MTLSLNKFLSWKKTRLLFPSQTVHAHLYWVVSYCLSLTFRILLSHFGPYFCHKEHHSTAENCSLQRLFFVSGYLFQQLSYRNMSKVRQRIVEQIEAGYSYKIIARRLRVHQNIVSNVWKLHEESGGFIQSQNGGWPQSSQTKCVFATVKKKINHNPKRSIPQLANDLKMDYVSLIRNVQDNLGLKWRAREGCQT